jgi:hypothetical protein
VVVAGHEGMPILCTLTRGLNSQPTTSRSVTKSGVKERSNRMGKYGWVPTAYVRASDQEHLLSRASFLWPF